MNFLSLSKSSLTDYYIYMQLQSRLVFSVHHLYTSGFVNEHLPVGSSGLLELCLFVFQLLFQLLLAQTHMFQSLFQLSLLACFQLQLLLEPPLSLDSLLPQPMDLTVPPLNGLQDRKVMVKNNVPQYKINTDKQL